MNIDRIEQHNRLAEAVRRAVVGDHAVTDAPLRAGAMARAAGGAPIAEPYDRMAHRIGEAAHLLTDADVAAVRAAAGSDKGAFEIVLSASIGAGLRRWDAARRAIEEADDETA
jgi:hypothetical protein